jgi:tetratricopeptide (TPR) repeat protein
LNSILLIKEPFLRPRSIQTCEIKVDSPSDLVILSEIDRDHKAWKYTECVPKQWLDEINPEATLEELKRLGNVSFVKKDFRQAIRMYTRALNLESVDSSEMERKTLLSNRAAAFLRIEKYFSVYQDTLDAEKIKTSTTSLSEKVCFRMGEALYAMWQWEKALDAFTKCVEINGIHKEAIERVKRTKARINETLTGHYDMNDVIRKTRNQFVPRLDVADFMSNQIEVLPISGDQITWVCFNKITISQKIPI